MPTANHDDPDAIARALRAYLLRNPHAADTADGILAWWLGANAARCSPAQLQATLDAMTNRNELVVMTNVSGEPIYTRHRELLENAEFAENLHLTPSPARNMQMKHIVENMTRRPVTLMGNSGKYYHLPPRYKLEIAALEVANNAFVDKLATRQVLTVHASAKARKTEEVAEKAESKDAHKKDKRPK